MKTQKCTCCRQEKPISEFYKHGKVGGVQKYSSRCKTCIKASSNYQDARIGHGSKTTNVAVDGLKYCKGCDKTKPAHRFYDKGRSLRTGETLYSTYCKCCTIKRSEDRRAANPEKSAEYNRNSSRRHKRRALLAKVPSDDWKRSEIFQPNCVYCGCEITMNNFHADHYIPISKGGPNTRDNIVPACSACNLSKHDKLPLNFIIERLNR